MRVYLVSYGERGEGGTVISVKSTLDAAKAAADRHVESRVATGQRTGEWRRVEGFAWERWYTSCDAVRVERWAVTT